MLFVLCDVVAGTLKTCNVFVGFDPLFPKAAVDSCELCFALSLLYPIAADEHSDHH